MRNKLRKLNTEVYLNEEEKFFKKYSEYMSKKVEINKEENMFISKIDKGNNFSEKSDIYFDEYRDVVSDFKKRREKLKKKYKKYTSLYNSNFYTILNKEYINSIKNYNNVTKQTAESLLKFIEENKGKYFIINELENKKYQLKYIAVQIDDYYYVGINEEGKEQWISGAFKLIFTE